MSASEDSSLAILRLAWRLDALDEWRRTVEKRVGAIEHELGELVRAAEIMEAVAEKMEQTHTLHLTKVQRRVAFSAALVATFGGVVGIASAIVHLIAGSS